MDSLEKELYKKGFNLIVGIDEAGRGPIAGPLIIASVIFKKNQKPFIYADSKKLTERKREYFYNQILDNAEEVNIVIVENTEIDEKGISKAVKEGIEENLSKLKSNWDAAIIDYVKINNSSNIISIKKADEISHTVAAASIVAKVTRDRIMKKYKDIYPSFSFDVHKGYPTIQHYQEIEKYGITPIHRKSFNLRVKHD